MTNIAIVGGRDYSDYAPLVIKMYHLSYTYGWDEENTTILCGKARGADTLGEKFASDHGIPIKEYKPEWKIYGKQAGILRNMEMSNDADVVVAFWDGKSKGTKHMVDFSKESGKVVYVYNY